MSYDLTEDGPSGAHIHRAYIAAFMDLVPEIDGSAFIAPTAAVIGAVRIGANSSVWHQATLRGDNNYIVIGENTNIQDNCCLHIDSRKHPTIIGDNVTIGHSALVHACTIGDGAFVGMGSMIMDGAAIEPGGMLAAGAMLTPGKVIPAGEIWAGRPAQKMRDMTADDIANLTRAAAHYVEVARAHRLGADGAPYENMHWRPLPPKD